VSHRSATAVRDASFIRSGALLRERRAICGREQESVQTDPGDRAFAAAIQLPSGSQCPKRFEPAGEFRPFRFTEGGRCGAANRDRRQQTRRHCRTRRRGGAGETCVHEHGSARESHRQERGRTQNLAWPTNKRGGTSSREDLALSRRAVHRRHPALPGCADEAVRNSCVRGKER